MKKYINIQIFRIVSCMFVWLVHIGQLFDYDGIVRKVMDIGKYAPYMFFIISGFVVFYSNAERENYNVKQYYINRFFRVMPLYYMVIFFYFVLHTYLLKDVPLDESGLGWLRYIFVLNQIIPEDDIFWCNLGATWTISCFVLFYILFPIIKKWISNIYSSIALWIVCILICKITIGNIRIEPIYYLHYFVFGSVLYFAVNNKKEKLMLFFLLSCLLILLTLKKEAINYILCLFFGIIILSTMGLSVKNAMILKLVDVLDKYSYTLYLCHPVVHELCRYGVLPKVLPIVILCVIFLCLLAHEFYEKSMDTLYKRICGHTVVL